MLILFVSKLIGIMNTDIIEPFELIHNFLEMTTALPWSAWTEYLWKSFKYAWGPKLESSILSFLFRQENLGMIVHKEDILEVLLFSPFAFDGLCSCLFYPSLVALIAISFFIVLVWFWCVYLRFLCFAYFHVNCQIGLLIIDIMQLFH